MDIIKIFIIFLNKNISYYKINLYYINDLIRELTCSLIFFIFKTISGRLAQRT
nr:hypothetical protein B11C_110199 [Bartonella sp. 1-1C]